MSDGAARELARQRILDSAEIDRLAARVREAEAARSLAERVTLALEVEVARLRETVARVEALADEWEAAAKKPRPTKAEEESQHDQGVRVGVWHSVQRAAQDLRATLRGDS